MRKSRVFKIGAIVLAIPLVLVIILLIVGWVYSLGKTPPIVDAQGNPVPNSIVSSEMVVLGGVEQWILIRGRDKDKPVLPHVAAAEKGGGRR